jgi:hypothetical protein
MENSVDIERFRKLLQSTGLGETEGLLSSLTGLVVDRKIYPTASGKIYSLSIPNSWLDRIKKLPETKHTNKNGIFVKVFTLLDVLIVAHSDEALISAVKKLLLE